MVIYNFFFILITLLIDFYAYLYFIFMRNDEAVICNINIWRTCAQCAFTCVATYIMHYWLAYSFNTFWLISPSDFIYLCEFHGTLSIWCLIAKNPTAEQLSIWTRNIARFFNYRKLEMARVIFIRDILRHVAVWMRKRALRYIDFCCFFFFPCDGAEIKVTYARASVKRNKSGTMNVAP